MKTAFITALLLFIAFGARLVEPAALPPRPTVEPIQANEPYEGGIIELRVGGMTAPLWSEVEWQDASGNWHTVDGWRGTVAMTQRLQWWVGAENLGEKTFRWRVYDAPAGDLLATSETFDLPAHNLQRVIVPIALDA